MKPDTKAMGNTEYAAYMRARRGELPKQKPAKPVEPPDVRDNLLKVDCCEETELERIKESQSTRLYRCKHCNAVQYDPLYCTGETNRRTNRTTTLLRYATAIAKGTPGLIHFVVANTEMANALRDETVRTARGEGRTIAVSNSRNEVEFDSSGGTVKFVTWEWTRQNRFLNLDMAVYDHHQPIHEGVA